MTAEENDDDDDDTAYGIDTGITTNGCEWVFVVQNLHCL